MEHQDLEDIYTTLALKIDDVGKEHSEVFLAKLILLLAHKNGDADEVKRCIDAAAKDIVAK